MTRRIAIAARRRAAILPRPEGRGLPRVLINCSEHAAHHRVRSKRIIGRDEEGFRIEVAQPTGRRSLSRCS
jgi:hypothetical protein